YVANGEMPAAGDLIITGTIVPMFEASEYVAAANYSVGTTAGNVANARGTIALTIDNLVGDANNTQLIFMFDAETTGLRLLCDPATTQSTIPPQYLPSNCR